MLPLKNAWLQCAVGRSFKSLLGVEIVVEILQLELIDLTKRLSSAQIFQIMCANVFLKCKLLCVIYKVSALGKMLFSCFHS